MENSFSLKGRKVLVTGASSGIGRQVAVSISAQGAEVVIVARNESRLKSVYESLHGSGHSYYVQDLTDYAGVDSFVRQLSNIDGVVHSTGILRISPLKIANEDHLKGMMETNYFAPVHLTRSLLGHKRISDGGAIVFIASVNGTSTYIKGFGGYAGSKAALNSVAKIFALEYASRKIRVNTVSPGMINTEMTAELQKSVSSENIKTDKLRYPLGDYGDPVDVANACIFLLSDASKWVTGISLVVDGGLTIT